MKNNTGKTNKTRRPYTRRSEHDPEVSKALHLLWLERDFNDDAIAKLVGGVSRSTIYRCRTNVHIGQRAMYKIRMFLKSARAA